MVYNLALRLVVNLQAMTFAKERYYALFKQRYGGLHVAVTVTLG